jgi:tetratricopeptide (TPR) repeat protein
MPTLDLAARAGDLSRRLGRPDQVERYYVMAEQIGRETSVKSEAALARFLSERDRKIDDAVRLAEEVARHRDDIFTDDALAWAYFKAGRLADARAASRRMLRTGSRDRRLLYHAAAIERALGHTAQARQLARRALDGPSTFDLIAAPEAEALLK